VLSSGDHCGCVGVLPSGRAVHLSSLGLLSGSPLRFTSARVGVLRESLVCRRVSPLALPFPVPLSLPLVRLPLRLLWRSSLWSCRSPLLARVPLRVTPSIHLCSDWRAARVPGLPLGFPFGAPVSRAAEPAIGPIAAAVALIWCWSLAPQWVAQAGSRVGHALVSEDTRSVHPPSPDSVFTCCNCSE